MKGLSRLRRWSWSWALILWPCCKVSHLWPRGQDSPGREPGAGSRRSCPTRPPRTLASLVPHPHPTVTTGRRGEGREGAPGLVASTAFGVSGFDPCSDVLGHMPRPDSQRQRRPWLCPLPLTPPLNGAQPHAFLLHPLLLSFQRDALSSWTWSHLEAESDSLPQTVVRTPWSLPTPQRTLRQRQPPPAEPSFSLGCRPTHPPEQSPAPRTRQPFMGGVHT